jgi:hypothetical protein
MMNVFFMKADSIDRSSAGRRRRPCLRLRA